jgi:EAL domain-containing protein (putative c-di-GMP-specific phosphodiesterase class I)
MIDDYEGPRAALFELRRHGISIALDDFGTGYSSLTHLRQLPVDRIKIDQSFIAEMTERADCVAIVSAIIALGNTLGIKVTAEGVETEEHFSILQALGCAEAQGYLFSRPVPWAEMHTTLSGHGSNAVIAA